MSLDFLDLINEFDYKIQNIVLSLPSNHFKGPSNTHYSVLDARHATLSFRDITFFENSLRVLWVYGQKKC